MECEITLIAKKTFTLVDMFENEHNIEEGQEFQGTFKSVDSLQVVSVNIDGYDMYYYKKQAEQFFDIELRALGVC